MYVNACIVLDPRYKLSHFSKMQWKDEWIANARTIVEKAFLAYSDPDFELVEEGDDHNDDILMVRIAVLAAKYHTNLIPGG